MNYNFTLFKDEAKKIEEWLSREFASLHTGRATPAVLDKVSVDSYGSKQPISHVASISVSDARSLLISPWDKELAKEIERAILASNLGLSVSSSDDGVRVSFPELTYERREALVKVVGAKLEDARVALRAKREEVWHDIQEKEKNGEMSEDEKFRFKDDLQKLVDEANKKLEEAAERKEKDIIH